MRLQLIDDLTRHDHYFLTEDDICFFFGSYLTGSDFRRDDFHQLFFNFKKPLDSSGQFYKKRDIDSVGEMIARAFPMDGALFIPVPPSTAKSEPDYDARCLQALEEAKRLSAVEMFVSDVLRQRESMEPTHLRQDRYRPEDYRANYEIVDRESLVAADQIVVFDDLITTGAHFRAISDLVREINPRADVFGLFLGRRVIPSEPEDDDIPF